MVRRIVYKKFKRQCNCRDDIDNLISEGTIYLIDALAKDNETGNLDAYLFICVSNRLRSYIRKWNRERKTVRMDKYIGNHSNRLPPIPSHKIWLLNEIERYIPEGNTKTILRLFKRGYTNKEICKVLKLPDTTSVQSYIHNLRYKAVRIMKQRSMGIINSQWMFNDPKFDRIKA